MWYDAIKRGGFEEVGYPAHIFRLRRFI